MKVTALVLVSQIAGNRGCKTLLGMLRRRNASEQISFRAPGRRVGTITRRRNREHGTAQRTCHNHLVAGLLADDDGAVQAGRARVQFAVMAQVLRFPLHDLQVLAARRRRLCVPDVLVDK